MTINPRAKVQSAWLVGALIIASAALGLQGWKSRIPTVDLLPNIDDARAFAQAGSIPRTGTLSSFVAFTPPGTTWLLVPGVMLSDDVRTLEYAATTTLHALTVIGVFLLARSAFGAATAYTAATTFAFSSIGLFFATSLWPRGHPAFYVWFVYALHRWVLKGKPWALAEAIVIWAAGMYVFMEIAPAILAIPVAFLLYRPRTHLPSIALAIVIVALIWEPYLAFQSSRGFVDLQALLRRENVYSGGLPGNYRHTWCDPTLPLAGVVDETAVKTVALNMGRQVESAGWKHALVRPGVAVVRSSAEVLRNAAGSFAVALNLDPLRYLLLGATILAIWSCRPKSSRLWQALPSRLSWRVRLTSTAGFIAAALVSGVLPQLLSPDGVLEPATDAGLQSLQVGFIAAAFGMLAVPLLRHARNNMRTALAARPDGWRVAQFLSGAFVVPWLAMLAVTDPQRPERFWWLFPLQAIFMSAAFTAGAQQSRSRMVRQTSALLLIMSTCVTPATTQRATEWWANGWSGQDADEIQVVDYVASRLQGGRSASISYNVYFAEYTAALSEVDRRYRVGAQMDLLFEHRHGIRNVNRCPEGVAPHDDYRIAEMRSPALGLDHRLALSLDQYRLLAEVGRFRIFERSD